MQWDRVPSYRKTLSSKEKAIKKRLRAKGRKGKIQKDRVIELIGKKKCLLKETMIKTDRDKDKVEKINRETR